MKGRAVAMTWIAFVVGLSLAADLIFPEGALRQNVAEILRDPGPQHLFGTDSLGRDLLLRLLSGTKVSLGIGIASAVLSLALGTVYGLFAGWRGGWVDRALMALTDIFIAIPSFVFVAVFLLAFQKGVPWESGIAKSALALTLGIGLSHWMTVARVTRALTWRAKHLPYVEAARALGVGEQGLLRRHVLPNIGDALWTLFGLQIPANIIYESSMSFMGIGIQPPQSSWGVLVQEGWSSLATHPHLILFPCLVLFLTVWSLQSLVDQRAGSTRGGLQPPNPSSSTSATEMAR